MTQDLSSLGTCQLGATAEEPKAQVWSDENLGREHGWKSVAQGRRGPGGSNLARVGMGITDWGLIDTKWGETNKVRLYCWKFMKIPDI